MQTVRATVPAAPVAITTAALAAGSVPPDPRLIEDDIPAGDPGAFDPSSEPSDVEQPQDDSRSTDVTIPEPAEESGAEGPIE